MKKINLTKYNQLILPSFQVWLKTYPELKYMKNNTFFHQTKLTIKNWEKNRIGIKKCLWYFFDLNWTKSFFDIDKEWNTKTILWDKKINDQYSFGLDKGCNWNKIGSSAL